MPDTPELQKHFGQPPGQAAGCGFPSAHWLALVHFGSGLFQKVITGALQKSELSGASQMHPELEAGDVLLGDRVLIAWWASAWAVLLALGFRRNPDFTPKPARFRLQTLMLATLIVPAAYMATCWVCAMAGPLWVLTCEALGID